VRRTAERLLAGLARLDVRITDVAFERSDVPVPSYPDGPRPSSTVTLTGAGDIGLGEHVGWSAEAHAAFGAATGRVPRGSYPLGDWCRALPDVIPNAYDRAALESAAVDLALRQHGVTLFELAGLAPTSVRYVRSFDRTADPLAAANEAAPLAVKLDVDPTWSDGVLRELARIGRVAIVDWKTEGSPADHARVAHALPEAIIEDPGPADGSWPTLAATARVSADGWIVRPDDLARLPRLPDAVNVKVGRMGGVLPALTLAAAAEAAGIAVYVGGMFEVGAGRRQAQTLAALLSPDGPNDVAPIHTTSDTPSFPARLSMCADTPGFGATP